MREEWSIEKLEASLAAARDAPYDTEFLERVRLALRLADTYLAAGELSKARSLLKEESDYVEEIFRAVQLAGTPGQKRATALGRSQVRDRERQLALLGEAAPEISIKSWLQGEPTTLADLSGRVVLLDFWATWCNPCRALFPKLKLWDEEFRWLGLEIIAITRHYMAKPGDEASEAEELSMMRGIIEAYGLAFRVGVATDERTQELYGATGIPTVALIDREGVVRHIGSGTKESDLEEAISRCL